MWIIFGIASVFFTGWNMLYSFFGKKRMDWVAFCALACLSLTAWSEYAMVDRWVGKEDWGALLDVVPSMNGMLRNFIIIMLLLNFIALLGRHFAAAKVEKEDGSAVL